ncbi:phosphatase yihX [Desarmillaria ectypa]|nr:phosphatase yihX [Desarmillaria ectypa]
MSPPPFNTIIFDIGDVLFTWSSTTSTRISSKSLRKILACPTWLDYERGKVSEKDCYDRVGKQFSFDPLEVKEAFSQARDSLKSDDQMINLIRELKEQSHSQLRVFAMSNISLPDYEVLKTKSADWSIFDRVFTSGEAGERKPDIAYYRHVLTATNTVPSAAIFVDDRPENVLSARSLGLHGIVFDDKERVQKELRGLFGEP